MLIEHKSQRRRSKSLVFEETTEKFLKQKRQEAKLLNVRCICILQTQRIQMLLAESNTWHRSLETANCTEQMRTDMIVLTDEMRENISTLK